MYSRNGLNLSDFPSVFDSLVTFYPEFYLVMGWKWKSSLQNLFGKQSESIQEFHGAYSGMSLNK